MSALDRLRERFWFLPAVLCLAAAVLAEGLVAVDERLGTPSIPEPLGALLYRVGASGSRDVLGAIASSSLGVAGTTFSITIAVLALTSSTYGPRLVRNFMSDRGNQAVLGVFVATFLYSLLVLRSIRDVGDAGSGVFVPHLAVNAAVLLAVADVAVLIYFVHHISDSIQISTLTGRVRAELLGTIDRLYPASADADRERAERTEDERSAPDGPGVAVTAARSGYVQRTDDDALLRTAVDRDVVVVVDARVGRYVLEGATLARVHPAAQADDGVLAEVGDAFHLADVRTPHRDPEFSVQQLTEMAVRALSPGTNDPGTAVNALDDLSAALAVLAGRVPSARTRRDDGGTVRVLSPDVDPGELVGAVLDSMRWYATAAPSVMHAALVLVERVATRAVSAGLRAQLVDQIGLLERAFATAGHDPHDVAAYADHAAAVRCRLTA